ncbi:hypothetical protein Srufu_080190 (plasmid) [Streptomyces libani subsp. rufus]|nr:hypothetical protein Srufu_080190 [Streptomyces libani subsp. rufus]
MAPSPDPQPSDWHDTIIDLLAMDRGIPEDRARRFLARYAEEARASTPAPSEQRSDALAAIDRVQAVAREWEFMSGRTAARNELLAALNGTTREQR